MDKTCILCWIVLGSIVVAQEPGSDFLRALGEAREKACSGSSSPSDEPAVRPDKLVFHVDVKRCAWPDGTMRFIKLELSHRSFSASAGNPKQTRGMFSDPQSNGMTDLQLQSFSNQCRYASCPL